MYTCSWCGKPTPNYREYSHPMAGILGESGYSICDECLRKVRIEREWENEQCAEERLICPYCESSIDDPWYYDEDDEEVECPECKRTFELEIATVRTYRTLCQRRRDGGRLHRGHQVLPVLRRGALSGREL